MFEFLRKGATSVFAKAFLAVIVIVFVFWGIGSFTGDRSQVLAEADGLKISLREFREYYNYQLYQLKAAFGDEATGMVKDPKFKETVLQDLIRKKLLARQGEKFGLRVSQREVELYLSQIPVFQERGAFNPAKYQVFLREVGITPKFFENLLGYDLLEQKISALFNSALVVSKAEVEEFARFYFQGLHFKIAEISYKACSSELKPSEKDLENFFLTRRDLYFQEERVKLTYHFLSYEGEVEVSDREIKDYYLKNLSRFKEPLKVKLRRILLKGSDQATLAKAQALREKLKDLKDFSQYGAKTGEWFEEGSLPENLKNLLKVAKAGTILGPLKGEDGYLILGIEEISPERLLKLDEVKNKIVSELREEKLKAKVFSQAHELYAKVVKEDGLSNLAKKGGLKLEESPYLSRQEALEVFKDTQMVERIFKEQKGGYLSPISTSKGVYLVEIKDRRERRNLTFAEAKERVREDYLKEKGRALCEEKAKALLAEIKKGQDLVNSAPAKGFAITQRKVLRKDLDPNLAVVKTVKPGLFDEPQATAEGIKIFYLEKIEPSGNLTAQDLALAKESLLSLKKEIVQRSFLTVLQDKARIKVYPLFHQI